VKGLASYFLRRSALTASHQAGLNLREVAEISGHLSLAALECYLDQDVAREEAKAARVLLVGRSPQLGFLRGLTAAWRMRP
jgi:hypothetical protein